MPKILENIRENLLQEARRQIMEQGYSTMTIRSVAAACGVGVGTVYNYFPSKDNLIANFMLEDWRECLGLMQAACTEQGTSEQMLKGVYDALMWFVEKYTVLFEDESALAEFSGAFQQRHTMLRSQVAAPLVQVCCRQSKVEPAFLADFIAESLLTWTMNGCTFEKISSVLLQLF